ncbi:MAG: tetratricopeptide repeat protein, partial [Proteobacteria bacterium]|nr:tetratricopeptide repeat protein [Pseudomonadota bacterium]
MNSTKLAQAYEAFQNKDFSKADTLLKELEDSEKFNSKQFSQIAFIRGSIAEDDIRWEDAAKHYTRAANIDPNFDTLITAHRLNRAIGNYSSALSFGLKAQEAASQDYEEDSVQYVTSLNNLGELYYTQANYEKAEDSFNEALNICRDKLKDNAA